MACSSCNKKKYSPTQVLNNVFNTGSVIPRGSCNITEEEMTNLLGRLNCYKQKKKGISINQPLSFILTMINTKDFCRYNMDEIKNILDGEDC